MKDCLAPLDALYDEMGKAYAAWGENPSGATYATFVAVRDKLHAGLVAAYPIIRKALEA